MQQQHKFFAFYVHLLFTFVVHGVWKGRVSSHCRFIFLTGILQGACIHPLSVYFCSGVWQGGVFSHCRFIFLTSILQKRAFTHFFFIFVVVHGRGVYSSTDFDA